MPSDTKEHESEEVLPFDVEIERMPTWVSVASGLVVVSGVAVAARLLPMFALIPWLVASSLTRRFLSSAVHVEVADGLTLGESKVPRAEILDVWLDEDPSEACVIVARASQARAKNAELLVMHFENRDQARRFAEALGPCDAVVVGHAPRPIDALPSLRFAALAAAFFGTGSWFGFLALPFFALGVFSLVRAKQVIATNDRFELSSAFGSRSFAYRDVETVDIDGGVVQLEGGTEIAIERTSIRDATMAAPVWLDRARARVLRRIAEGARSTE